MSSTGRTLPKRTRDCKICGVFAGSGLLAASAYVCYQARKSVAPGYIPLSASFKLVFALGIAGVGVASITKSIEDIYSNW